MILNDWQRIEKIVRWTGLSVNSFALNVGLNRGENLYQIKRGNNGISKELAELISAKYPEISRAWILTGEGEMLTAHSGERSAIPVYDIDAVLMAGMDKLPQPSYLMSLPRAKGVAFGALMLNRSMEPAIPNGATVLLAEKRTDEIIPGYPYMIVSDRITAIRTVRTEPESEKLRLTAANPEFGDMLVDICEVRKLYLVTGFIYFNQ